LGATLHTLLPQPAQRVLPTIAGSAAPKSTLVRFYMLISDVNQRFPAARNV
jgi:hypothetical protein